MSELLGEKQAELYDRQIRLWGVEAQAKMQSSKVLICGIQNSIIFPRKNNYFITLFFFF